MTSSSHFVGLCLSPSRLETERPKTLKRFCNRRVGVRAEYALSGDLHRSCVNPIEPILCRRSRCLAAGELNGGIKALVFYPKEMFECLRALDYIAMLKLSPKTCQVVRSRVFLAVRLCQVSASAKPQIPYSQSPAVNSKP